MIVAVGDERSRGRAFDLRDAPVDASALARAVRGVTDGVTVRCPDPGPVHERVGVIRPDRNYPIRAALAAAARTRGHESSVDADLAEVREELSDLDAPAASTAAERRRVATAGGGDAEALAERVSELRGRIEAAEAGVTDEDPDALRADLRAAAADLADRRTDRIAAEQALSAAREEARRARDRRERRLHLQDRERNLQREARRELAAAVEPAFERALAAVPGECSVGERPGAVEGDETTAALAVCRVAPLSAPVVLACDRFPTATAARAAVDAPVILV